mgnify:FL=1
MNSIQAKEIQRSVNKLIANPEAKSTAVGIAVIRKEGDDILIRLKNILK